MLLFIVVKPALVFYSNMLLRMADDMIKESMAKGDFDNLPGKSGIIVAYLPTVSVVGESDDECVPTFLT